MSKTKIKEISLEECLKNLSKEELNKLYKETDEDLKSKIIEGSKKIGSNFRLFDCGSRINFNIRRVFLRQNGALYENIGCRR